MAAATNTTPGLSSHDSDDTHLYEAKDSKQQDDPRMSIVNEATVLVLVVILFLVAISL
jgi:hypothetical protein